MDLKYCAEDESDKSDHGHGNAKEAQRRLVFGGRSLCLGEEITGHGLFGFGYRAQLAAEKGRVEAILVEGTEKMIEISNQTLKEVRSAMGISGTWKKLRRQAGR